MTPTPPHEREAIARDDLAKRLRNHVIKHGGPAKDENGKLVGTVWQMMLDAADLLSTPAQAITRFGNYEMENFADYKSPAQASREHGEPYIRGLKRAREIADAEVTILQSHDSKTAQSLRAIGACIVLDAIDDEIESLKSPAPAPVDEAPDWQPIESAPKDGTPVLVCHSAGGACQAVAMFMNSDWWTTVSFTLLDPSPTHWLPTTPKQGS